MVPVIVGICLCIGYIAKHWTEDMNNKYIPTMCAVVGVILAIWMSGWKIPQKRCYKAYSAVWRSHQMFAQPLKRNSCELQLLS